MYSNRDSEFQESFAFEIQLKDSGIPLTIEILNPS